MNKAYELHEHDPLGLQFTHQPYQVKTLPNQHSLCGTLTYTSTFMTLAIGDLDPFADTMSDPVGYDAATLMHSVYSEDFGLLGFQPYTVTATLTEYSTVSKVNSA